MRISDWSSDVCSSDLTGSNGTVVCIGKADGAEVGQKLEVYRVVTHPGPSKGVAPTYHRQLVGHVTIDHIFDDHFAHVSVADGTPAKHDIVELDRKSTRLNYSH